MGMDILGGANNLIWGCQRKEWGDLYASMTDGRLAKEVAQMCKVKIAVLIVEGQPHWDNDGRLIDRYRTWTRSQYRRLLMSIQDKGVWVMNTDNMLDTIDLITDIEAWIGKGDQHFSLARRPGPSASWGKPTNADFQVHMVCGLPGIGPKLAKEIIKATGGMPFGWKITKEDLLKVPGIGKQRADMLWATLEELNGGLNATQADVPGGTVPVRHVS